MKLYLVQHAKAASEQVDPQRPLTEEGRRDVQRVAAFIKPLNLCVDYLWHSGKKRAAQTAELLAEVIRINKAKTARDGLGPNDDVTVLRDELTSPEGDVMIVGHLPFVSKLASLLLAGFESADTVAFRQGGIVCLSRSETDEWQIDWMIIPELLI
jgi:phosphohistidine phosphatase